MLFYSEYYFVRAGIYGILIHPREQWAFREAQEHKEDRERNRVNRWKLANKRAKQEREYSTVREEGERRDI